MANKTIVITGASARSRFLPSLGMTIVWAVGLPLGAQKPNDPRAVQPERPTPEIPAETLPEEHP